MRLEVKIIVETQADRIIKKFGGISALAKALENAGHGKNVTTIYRWTYSRENGGCGGIIPQISLSQIIQVARAEGIFLSQEDLDPRPLKKKKATAIDKLMESK